MSELRALAAYILGRSRGGTQKLSRGRFYIHIYIYINIFLGGGWGSNQKLIGGERDGEAGVVRGFFELGFCSGGLPRSAGDFGVLILSKIKCLGAVCGAGGETVCASMQICKLNFRVLLAIGGEDGSGMLRDVILCRPTKKANPIDSKTT